MKPYLTPDKISYQLSNLRQLTFEITDACNLRCKYCGYGEFYEDYDKRENKELSEVSAIHLLNYLMPHWNSSQNVSSDRNVYISFYGGEPLLNMKFIKKLPSSYSLLIEIKHYQSLITDPANYFQAYNTLRGYQFLEERSTLTKVYFAKAA